MVQVSDTSIFVFLALFYTCFFGLMGLIPYNDVSITETEVSTSTIDLFFEDYTGYSYDNTTFTNEERYSEILTYVTERNCSTSYLSEDPCLSYINEGGFFKAYSCKTAIRIAYDEGVCGSEFSLITYSDEENEYNHFYSFLGRMFSNITGMPDIVVLLVFSPLLIIGGYWLIKFILNFIPFLGGGA